MKNLNTAGTVKLYNTLSKRKEMITASNGELKVFVCGPTVYDYPHLGHAKTYTQFDFVVSYLRERGFTVTYLQNITDIDDKIIARAQRDGVEWLELARHFEAIYLQDMAALRNDSLDRVARATEHIGQIVSQISTLLAKGHAYKAADGIYFSLSSFEDYGKLSGRCNTSPDDAVSRIDESPEKRVSGDFCLWKRSKPGEPSWNTALGDGRPGWHIEDTAITETYFGPRYDIHGGAIDLIFPHHEAEIALMESASGLSPFVRYWLHTGFLNINKEKMSKSKGNLISIRNALGRYEPRVLRFAFLSQHYRTTFSLGEEVFGQAESAVRRLDAFAASILQADSSEEERLDVNLTRNAIYEALDDDVDTPGAFRHIFNFIRRRNAAGGAGPASGHLLDDLHRIFKIFDRPQGVEETVGPEVVSMLEARERLREQRRFSEADALRDQLSALGINMNDQRVG